MTPPQLVFAQLEVNPHNTDSQAVFGYFCDVVNGVPPATEDIAELHEHRDELREDGALQLPGCLDWAELAYDCTPRPNVLAGRGNLVRYLLGFPG